MRVLFYRDFVTYTGGHQKVFDYFAHALALGVDARISFSPRTHWDDSNPWSDYRERIVPFEPQDFDALFLAGRDWRRYPDDTSRPVLNLIQHIRHADPASEVWPFLTRPAIRIAVSPEIAIAIEGTGRVNGATVTIPNGIDVPLNPMPKATPVLVVAMKQPALGRQIAAALSAEGIGVTVLGVQVARRELLEAMARASVVVVLPRSVEGFYLPGLEAMALADIAVVPDCVGNRSYCRDGRNCLMPALECDALITSIRRARNLARSFRYRRIQRMRWRRAVARTLAFHSLTRERSQFAGILGDLAGIWSEVKFP